MAYVKGMKAVLDAIKETKTKYGPAMERALLRCGTDLIMASVLIVPVDTGNLRASYFIRKAGKGLTTVIIVGYTADYAVYVHEDLELRHGADYNSWYGEEISAGTKNPRKPEEQAKFLEQPMRQMKAHFRSVVLAEMQGVK